MSQCDLFVIGGGSGGVRAARVAARHGAKVVIAEEYRWGGTCVIRGCVPKKLFVYASRFRDEFEDAPGFGWSLAAPQFDWPTLVANKDVEIARLEGLYRSNLQNAGVEVIKGRAELLDANTVLVEPDARKIEARVVLIAVGARPALPELPGIHYAITSNEAFQLERLPPSILIAGGGYIAVEFASIFHGLGVATTLLYRGPKILRGFDGELRDGLTAALRERGITIDCHTEIAAIAKDGKHYRVTLKDGRQRTTGQVMFATGRVPNTRGLGLERAGVALGGKGAILVDAFSRSSVSSIYAVGDVTDRVNLTPVAIREGHAFADSVFGGRPTAVNHELVPTAVFATPEIGTAGLPEHVARIRYPRLDVYKAEFRPLKATLSGRRERMLMKLLVDGASDRVVGCHVLGVDAAEIVQMAAIAMHMGARKADFDQTLALHPSAAEELVTMREKWSAPGAQPIARGGDAAS
jgi:glutathione reductase (NADPH)